MNVIFCNKCHSSDNLSLAICLQFAWCLKENLPQICAMTKHFHADSFSGWISRDCFPGGSASGFGSCLCFPLMMMMVLAFDEGLFLHWCSRLDNQSIQSRLPASITTVSNYPKMIRANLRPLGNLEVCICFSQTAISSWFEESKISRRWLCFALGINGFFASWWSHESWQI